MTEKTVALARAELREAAKGKGARCPCCDKFARVAKTPISRAMVHAFEWICRESQKKGGQDFVPVQRTAPGWIKDSNSHAKLAKWGLLEDCDPFDDSTKRSGHWRPTMKGLRWRAGQIGVRKYALIYNNECLGFDGPMMQYRDHFSKFHYGELLQLQANQKELEV